MTDVTHRMYYAATRDIYIFVFEIVRMSLGPALCDGYRASDHDVNLVTSRRCIGDAAADPSHNSDPSHN